MSELVRIGTRSSELALAQTGRVAEALRASGDFEIELVQIRSEGDRVSAPIASLGGTGAFATSLRMALLAGRCDLVVHSLKDLPTAPFTGLALAAVPLREDPRDVLVARDGLTLGDLPPGARVGTGSPRRVAALRAARPDIQVVDLRGNVDSRLRRVQQGDLDAVVLAAAGLTRLGRQQQVTDWLDFDRMPQAPGQGALAVEAREATTAEPTSLARALAELDDPASRWAVEAERAVLARLEAGCAAPIGAAATVREGGVHVQAAVIRPDGGRAIREETFEAFPESPTPKNMRSTARRAGVHVAELLLEAGAARLTEAVAR